MGSCEPGQGRKSAAISSRLHVWWASHRRPLFCGCRGTRGGGWGARGGRMRRSSRTQEGFPTDIILSSSRIPFDSAWLPQPARRPTRSPRPASRRSMWSSPGVTARRPSTSLWARSTSPGPCPTPSRRTASDTLTCSPAPGAWARRPTARILAKALNCDHGPTATPCNECDICRSISSGDDVDVLEIDGASNRGIDEIRQLRQNANVRPSRSRFKIYIIDEVHMLTREAFNALLKTLEEPPEHVKFIFCTTEASKIPVTILSRCQRFDFAGILTPSISQRLRADRRGRRGRGRARGPGDARPAGDRLDARQPIAVGTIAGLRPRADHRGRRTRHAGHGGRRTAHAALGPHRRPATRPPHWPSWTRPSRKASTWGS